jgi:hypothetical protein
MGHQRTRKQYKLTFEAPDHMVGLEVICRGPTRRQLFQIAALGDVDLDSLQGQGVEQLDQLCQQFGDRIIAWNHEDEDGNPLPPTGAVLDDEDPDFTLALVRAWMMTCMGTTPDARVEEHAPTPAQFEGQTSLEDLLLDLPMTVS